MLTRQASLTRAEDEVTAAKSRVESLSSKNVDLARENTQHKVKGSVLEEENKAFGEQIETLKEKLRQITNKELLQSMKREQLEKEVRVGRVFASLQSYV